MTMKFGRAYCTELRETVSPYRAREIYTEEDEEHFGKQLTFSCEDPCCRAVLTPVGIHMVRKSKRALHFRTKEEHKTGCGFLNSEGSGKRSRKPSDDEDEFKPTYFPTELDLNPAKHNGNGGGSAIDVGGTDGAIWGGTAVNHSGAIRRPTSTRTRYLDFVVDCFLSADEKSKNGNFAIEGKTKTFARFFKKIKYFLDEAGLIYYGTIDGLKIYNGKGIGLRFAEPVWVERQKYRVWVYVPQERVDASRRKKAFLAEMDELEKAVKSGEVVQAYFVGAYPVRNAIEASDGTTFDVYRAELSSIDHISLRFGR